MICILEKVARNLSQAIPAITGQQVQISGPKIMLKMNSETVQRTLLRALGGIRSLLTKSDTQTDPSECAHTWQLSTYIKSHTFRKGAL